MPNDIEYKPQPMDNDSRAYWEGSGRHELVLQRCKACGTVQHRPRALCVSCLSSEIEHFAASGKGSVHTYTVTHQNQAPAFRQALPYVLAYVELEEGPRILSNIVGCDPDSIAIGMPVQVEFVDVEGDLAVPRFRPG
jgi:uncharacterized OB-fold protein